MPASIYQHAPVLQIAPAVGTAAHMAQQFTGDLTILLMKCCCSSGGTCCRRGTLHWTANYNAFIRLFVNSKSVFHCSNKAVGAGWGCADAQEPSLLMLDLRLPFVSSRQIHREGMFIMMQTRLGETQSQHFVFPAICRGGCILYRGV